MLPESARSTYPTEKLLIHAKLIWFAFSRFQNARPAKLPGFQSVNAATFQQQTSLPRLYKIRFGFYTLHNRRRNYNTVKVRKIPAKPLAEWKLKNIIGSLWLASRTLQQYLLFSPPITH